MNFINLDDLEKEKVCDGEIAIIKAPVGYGKTHLAVNELRKLCDSKFPLLSVPTKAIKWQTVNDYDNAIHLDDKTDFNFESGENRVRVCCFSAIAQWLKDGNEIVNKPDLLILDEIDELAKWSMCFDGYLLAWDWVLSNRDKMKVIGLTATPQLLTDYVSEIPFVNVVRYLEPKYKAKSVEVITHSSARTYLKTLDYGESNKAIVYLQSAQLCAELAEQYPNAGFLISEYNESEYKKGDKPLNQMMMEQTIEELLTPG